MLSKTSRVATAFAVVLLAASCSRWIPWRNEKVNEEVNLSFTLEQNLITLPSTLLIDNHSGRFILGTAARQTVIDEGFAARGRALQIREKESLPLSPVRMNLQGVADAIIGADAWRNRAISIDYRSGLVTYQKSGIERSQMQIFRYRDEPSVWIYVNGQRIAAVVDTSSPDTLVLPGAYSRGTVGVVVAGTNFGPTDVQFANVTRARIGNRLLSRFLVSIDYGNRVVGLWRDPRIPM
ncbi:MAG TPA: hypothetical protein VEU30_10670 [Thermoanaerobaculia bacterium]|nr:hypothetical protein [Thermoanaerobaculia bacterium]